MKHLIFLLLLIPITALAQDDISLSPDAIGNGKFLGAKTADGQTTVPVLGVLSDGSTMVNALSGEDVALGAAKTPGAYADESGIRLPAAAMVRQPLPVVITPATAYPTPASGTLLTEQLTMVATAAPTANFVELAKATTVPESPSFGLLNPSANPVAIVPRQGDSVNNVAAGTPYSCAASKLCNCRKISTSRYWCVSE